MLLELEGLEVQAGSFHLGPISLRVADGEYLVVLGPSGAGKTVTLEAIAGLRKAFRGRLLMDGRDVTLAPPESRRIGFVYQDSLLFPHLSVRGNLAYGARRTAPAERDATIARLARLLQIEPLLERVPRGLSGGERQRVALARAMAANPLLLLLDEPMAALDPNSRFALRESLRELHRELGTTTIHVTHNFAEALALAGRIAILIQGQLLQVAYAREVFAEPASPAIARFLKSAVSEERLPSPADCMIALYPKSLALSLPSDGESSPPPHLDATSVTLTTGPVAGHTITGRILSLERNDAAFMLLVDVGLRLTASVGVDQPGLERLFEGAGILIRVPPRSSEL